MVTLAYLTNYNDDRVSVLDTATNAVIATVNVGGSPLGVFAVSMETGVYLASGNYGWCRS